MKKSVSLGLLCLLFSGLCFAEKVLTIRSDTWYPMNGDPTAAKPGYMIEIATVIMNNNGYKVDYAIMPWKRSLQKVKDGTFDCVVGAYKDDGRYLVFPTEEWGIDRVDFYIRKGTKWQYEGLNSLKTATIGLIGSYAYEKEFDALVAASNDPYRFQQINENNALELNIKKLLLGRITATVESIYVMKSKLEQMGLNEKIISAGTLKSGEKMYIACSPAKPTSKTFMQWFDEGIQALRQSGQLEKILDRYGLTDWKQPQYTDE